MKTFSRSLRYSTYALLVFVLAACGTTTIIRSHPHLTNSLNNDIAKVYFIRPDTGFDGVAGNAYTISLAGHDLLTIAKGEYTLVYLKSYSGDVIVESSTVAYRGGLNTWIKVKGSQHFDFEKNQTYYITFEPHFNDLGQGTYNVPSSITENVARKLANDLKPVGEAMAHPL